MSDEREIIGNLPDYNARTLDLCLRVANTLGDLRRADVKAENARQALRSAEVEAGQTKDRFFEARGALMQHLDRVERPSAETAERTVTDEQ